MNISLSFEDKLSLISNLETMLSAGIPLIDAVDALIAETKGNQQKILRVLREDLSQGKTISESFAKFPNAFNRVIINLIKGGEKSGTLEAILKDLKTSIRSDMEFNSQLKGALAYPILVLVVFTGVILLMLIFVLPRIAVVLEGLNVELPWTTRLLIAFSHLLLDRPLQVAAGAGVLVFIFVLMFIFQRKTIVNGVLALPVISTLVRYIDLTRFTRSMSLLLGAGIPITESLDLSERVILRKDIHNAVILSHQMVVAGKTLSEGFKLHRKCFPGMMIMLTEAGERSGSLNVTMQELSEYFNWRVQETLKKVTILLEPIMLVVIGLMVGGLMLSILIPIYKLISSI